MKRKIKHSIKVPYIEQMQQTECGLCCIAMISLYYKNSTSLYEMRKITGNGRDGTSFKKMKELAVHFNFDANWYRLPERNLGEVQFPCIIFWDNKHYVVVEKKINNKYIIVDPASGRKKISTEEFKQSYSQYILVCKPNEEFKRNRMNNNWIPYIKTISKKPKLLGAIIIVAIIIQLLTLGVPIIIQQFIDSVIIPEKKNLLIIFLIGILSLLLFQSTITLIRGRLLISLNNFLDYDMSTSFFSHILRLPYSFFQLHSFGDLLFRASSLMAIRNLLSNQLINGILNVGSIIVILIYMLSQSVLMTGWILLITLLSATSVIISRSIIYRKNQQEISASSKVQAFQTEILYGIFGIKVSGTEESMYKYWYKSFNELLIAYKKKGITLNYIESINDFLKMMGPLIVLWLGAKIVFEGKLSLGELIAFHTLSIHFFSLSSSLVDTVNSFILTDSYLHRVQDVMKSPEETQPEKPEEIEDFKGEIQLKNVSLSFTNDENFILKNINIDIKSGQKIALVGMSGAGKSTLARMILGLYEPSSGQIYYDKHNLLNIQKESFRKQVGIVPQDVSLFNRSIRDNIALHNPTASFEEIVAAAKLAQIHGEIMEMPMNYNTIISEMGMNISGGQRQRIAIAQALLNKPSILVFDEATSSLDHVNEKKIDEYLSSINCTRIVISHRLHSLVNSDVILVLDNGEIIESGTHKQLIEIEGFYSQYYNQQEGVTN